MSSRVAMSFLPCTPTYPVRGDPTLRRRSSPATAAGMAAGSPDEHRRAADRGGAFTVPTDCRLHVHLQLPHRSPDRPRRRDRLALCARLRFPERLRQPPRPRSGVLPLRSVQHQSSGGTAYEPGTNVLTTTWKTPAGWVVVRDALTMGSGDRDDLVTPHTRPPADDDAEHTLVRTVECIEGRVEIELVCGPGLRLRPARRPTRSPRAPRCIRRSSQRVFSVECIEGRVEIELVSSRPSSKAGSQGRLNLHAPLDAFDGPDQRVFSVVIEREGAVCGVTKSSRSPDPIVSASRTTTQPAGLSVSWWHVRYPVRTRSSTTG